jgi:SAM-dependent methyltransferase
MSFGARRGELRHYLKGDGIEVGALHQPFDVSGLPISRIRYVDRYDVPGLRAHYPELNDLPLVPVDIIDDGQVLDTVPDGSLDFVIANHMIEHCDNPLGTIGNWLSKLRIGGVGFIALPDQRKGWDERRPLTPLAHMVDDYHIAPDERARRNYFHFKEWVELVGNRQDDAEVEHLIRIDYSIHFHVFTYQTFRELLDYARNSMGFPFDVVDSMEPSEASWESIFILRRGAGPPPRRRVP